jgi:parvulin-like peptidyl-prolyl isomerase
MNQDQRRVYRVSSMSVGYGWILLFEIIFLMPPSGAFAQGEVLDRVVAVVNGEIITLSDIRTEKAMRNILGEPTAKNDRELLNELVNRRIIQTYLRQYPQANPTEAEIDEELAQIKDSKGLPTEAKRDAIREHLRVEYFFRERFAQSIIATDAEIQKYYEEVFVPAARARGVAPIPSLSQATEQIRGSVLMEKFAAEVKAWLEHARRTANIEIFD